MVPVVMEKPWVGPVAMIMVGVQNALPTIQQCVLSHCALLEDLIIVVTLRMDAVITEEYDHAVNQVGFNISQVMNIDNPKYYHYNSYISIFYFSLRRHFS